MYEKKFLKTTARSLRVFNSCISRWHSYKNCLQIFFIVRKEISTPPISKSSPPLLGYRRFPEISHPPILPTNCLSQVFLINRNATVKSTSINTIHVKQHNVGLFSFKFTLKYMLVNVHIYKIYLRQSLYIISLYCRKGFSRAFNFFVVSK